MRAHPPEKIHPQAFDYAAEDAALADLRGADLTGANLSSTSPPQPQPSRGLRPHTHLHGADLREARLTGANLTGAYYDRRARWPAGFDPRRASAVLRR